MELITCFLYAGTFLVIYETNTKAENTTSLIQILEIPLYIVSIYYSFLTYKELKALFIENATNAGIDLPSRPRNNEQPRRYFDGVGHRLS